MLTRLKVNGFKNLLGVDISFGPFTCIAGANGVGKSNLFDAIRFLSALADKPLLEAALSIRSEGGRSGDVRSLFHRIGDHSESEITFEAEMLVPSEGIDELGQEAKASSTFLTYQLTLHQAPQGLAIRREELEYIKKDDAHKHLQFPHSRAWRNAVVRNQRTAALISTQVNEDRPHILLHQDGGGGRPRPHLAERLPRTVLSSATNAAESPTAVLVRREMQSWRLLQLEPSALRTPDAYTAPTSIDASGAHLPATLARLARWPGGQQPNSLGEVDREIYSSAVYAEIANQLAELIEDVHSIRVEADDAREIFKLILRDRAGTEHEARSLSDGTLRFLALAILESDPSARGVLCLEEPENSIHPQRIPAMLRLLRNLATDPKTDPLGDALRQVIVNTHSPAVVAQVRDEDLLVVVPEIAMRAGHRCARPTFRWLADTWCAKARPNLATVPLGEVVNYLNAVKPPPTEGPPRPPRHRVIDRPELQRWL
jgi:predicted ATPase